MSIKEEIFDDIVYIGIESRDGMVESFLNISYIFLKKFGEDGEILISEANLVDAGILLAENGHKFINIPKNELVLVLADQRLLLEGTV